MGIGWVWKAAEGVARSFQSSSWNSKFEQSEVSNSNVLLFNSKWPSSYVEAGEAVVRSRLDFVPATASRRLLRDQGREGRGTGRRQARRAKGHGTGTEGNVWTDGTFVGWLVARRHAAGDHFTVSGGRQSRCCSACKCAPALGLGTGLAAEAAACSGEERGDKSRRLATRERGRGDLPPSPRGVQSGRLSCSAARRR